MQASVTALGRMSQDGCSSQPCCACCLPAWESSLCSFPITHSCSLWESSSLNNFPFNLPTFLERVFKPKSTLHSVGELTKESGRLCQWFQKSSSTSSLDVQETLSTSPSILTQQVTDSKHSLQVASLPITRRWCILENTP